MIRQVETSMTVMWQMPSGIPRRALADFVSVWVDTDLIAIRLVRVQVGAVCFGRTDAMIFDQPAERWEAAARAAITGNPPMRTATPDEVLADLQRALLELKKWDSASGFILPHHIRDPLVALLSAAEGAGK